MTATIRLKPRPTQEEEQRRRAAGVLSEEGAVLAQVLDRHPDGIAVAELFRVVGGSRDPGDVMRAVRNLAAADLVVFDGADLSATPAVARFDEAMAEGRKRS